jgi:phenylacetate-CoA ligase
MFNKWITKTLFSSYNVLHGGKLKKMYKEIRDQNDSSRVFEIKKLKNYLKTWEFGGEIEKLPIMTKEDIRKHISLLQQTEVSSFVYTGGSTGDPLKVPYSQNREMMRTASISYYNEIAGYQIGDPFLIIRAKERSKMNQFLRNELLFVPIDISRQKIEKISRQIVSQKIFVIIGYPSVIYEIARVFEADKDLKNNHSVKSIITVSEPIDDLKREFIRGTFECEVFDRYSNEEVGVIAQQREFGGDYIVDKYGIFVELLDQETLQPVKENEIGKVVVTDVYNDLIPVVRYDTGDYAMASEYREGQLYSIKKIAGRISEEILSTDGTPVSSLALGPYIHQPFSEANVTCQFQFAQVAGKKYQFRVRGERSEKLLKITEQITVGLKTILGKDANIETVFLEKIKSLPSGKRPLYKNEMKKDNFISDN